MIFFSDLVKKKSQGKLRGTFFSDLFQVTIIEEQLKFSTAVILIACVGQCSFLFLFLSILLFGLCTYSLILLDVIMEIGC